MLIEIGRMKLEQLATDFNRLKLGRKPVLMVLCEETAVAGHVMRFLASREDVNGHPYDDSRAVVVHSELPKAELELARRRLELIDDDADALQVVVSVLMLREGFDKKNIAVVVVLRATEADILLEQIVGRGLRLMFSEREFPELWDSKVDALNAIRAGLPPTNSLDFLFVVEHPRFRSFYENLRKQGFVIGQGDTSNAKAGGDIEVIDSTPDRVARYDVRWPVQVYEQGSAVDPKKVNIRSLARYPSDYETLRKTLGQMMITDTHAESGKRVGTWKLEVDFFDYAYFLAQVTKAIAIDGRTPIFSSRRAEIAGIVDEYVEEQLFGAGIDWSQPENYRLLNFVLVFDHVAKHVRAALVQLLSDVHFTTLGTWKRLSDVERIRVRSSYKLPTTRCIYPWLGHASKAGGLERGLIATTLENSASVLAYMKLDKRHGLIIPYRDASGIQRAYEVDFLIKTAERLYLLETKADADLTDSTVALKARAAVAWCAVASTLDARADFEQPTEWEYLLLSESTWKENQGISFDALLPNCRATRDRTLTIGAGRLF